MSTLSSYRYLQCFKHFSMFRNCRKMRDKTHRKNMKNLWKIDGKPAQNSDPHRGINKNIVFHFFFALGAAPGRFRGPAGVGKFHVFLKNGAREPFCFSCFFALRCMSSKMAPGGPREASGRPRGGPGDNFWCVFRSIFGRLLVDFFQHFLESFS